MASGIITDDGDDLDDILAPIAAGTPRAATGIKVGPQDIADRYFPSSYEQAGNTGPDDRPPLLTGIYVGETDIRNLFRSIDYAGDFSFATQPQSPTVTEGNPFTLSVTVQQAVGTVTYDWQRFDGMSWNSLGVTTSSYSVGASDRTDEGLYRCVATDSFAPLYPITSNNAIVTVNYLAVFTTHPAGGTHDTNTQLVLTATITEGKPSPAAISWTRDNQVLTNNAKYSGTNTLSLVINLDASDHASIYRCRASNAAGTVFSNTAILLINTPPVIASDIPSYALVSTNGTLNLSIGVYSYPAPTFQWYFNSNSMGSSYGAQTDGISIPGVTSANMGSYYCVATNPLGSAQSRTCFVQVVDPPVAPSFTSQPSSQSVRQGSTVQFTAIAYANPPAAYQWKKNEADIPGATSSTLSLYNVTNDNEGTYRCVATNVHGSASSNSVTLNVVMDPVITVVSASDSTPNYGDQVAVVVFVEGDQITGYQWQLNGANISGATSPTYVFMMDSMSKNGNYRCIVTNIHTSVASSEVSVIATYTDPVITGHPAGFTDTVGAGPYALQCSAYIPQGESPLIFRWYKDGILRAGPRFGNLSFTQDQHVIAALDYSDAGSWWCLVTTNFGGAVNSNSATVVVV